VVATRIAGVPRLIADGSNGLLVAPGSETELAQSLGRLLADADLRQQLRQAGRHTIETHYSFAARMDRMRAVYDDLLGPK
jgi:glycosyltransferase involved in cell wall biosynthesis